MTDHAISDVAELRRRITDLKQQLAGAQAALKQHLDRQCASAAEQLRLAETERDELTAEMGRLPKRAVGKKKASAAEGTATRDDMVDAAVDLVAQNPPGIETAVLPGLVKSHLKEKLLRLTGAFAHLETYLAEDGRLAIDAADRYVLASARGQVA